MLRGIFGTGGPASSSGTGQPPTLLSDWTSYSSGAAAGPRDVEAGAAGAAPSSTLFQSAGAAGTSVAGFFQDSLKTVSTNVTSGVSAVASGEAFSIPSGMQLAYFFAFLAGGGVFLLMSFMIFLPVIILSPSKFALSFTLGSLCIMAGFMQLRGWRQQMQHMLSQDRLPYSAAYVGSVFATLYAALMMHSYLLSLVCSGLQVVALLYYLMSYFPGGAQGVKFMLSMAYTAMLKCFASAYSVVMKG